MVTKLILRVRKVDAATSGIGQYGVNSGLSPYIEKGGRRQTDV